MSWTTPLTALPHLSDEAVAAFADGVLSGTARHRAQSHMADCGECSDAVYGQRSAIAMLRSASAPSVPSGLLDRLRELPITTDLEGTRFPSGLSADGQPMFAAFAGPAPMTTAPMTTAPMTTAPMTTAPVTTAPMTTASIASVLEPTGFHTAALAPAWSTTRPAPMIRDAAALAPTPARAGLPRHFPHPGLGAVRPHRGPAAAAPVRRRTSSRAGLGVAAVAAVAVGMLASTAAAAGGVTTTHPTTTHPTTTHPTTTHPTTTHPTTTPAVHPAGTHVVPLTTGQTQMALLTFIPSAR